MAPLVDELVRTFYMVIKCVIGLLRVSGVSALATTASRLLSGADSSLHLYQGSGMSPMIIIP